MIQILQLLALDLVVGPNNISGNQIGMFSRISTFALLCAACFLPTSSASGQNKVTAIADLRGMAGCWERRDETKNLLISEQWMSPAGTSIFGMGRTVKNGKTADWEFMRIEQRVDGLYFVALPKANKEETAFKLISSTLSEVTFENKEHDFPQRVIYKLNGKTMTGRIEGNSNGKFLGIDFPMVRVKCG